jgi:ribonuclease HII
MEYIDFSNMSYSSIKEYVDNIKFNYYSDSLKEQELAEAAAVLASDKRKNVQTLSAKIFNFIDISNKELERVKTMYNFDRQYSKTSLLAGVDEVGRGPLAGPIVAAAVILDLNISKDNNMLLGINDSKKLSSKTREELSSIIKSKAIAYSISSIDNNLIDTRGIAWCNNEIFRKSVLGLQKEPALVLCDGYPIKNFSTPSNSVIKGDTKSASIACASIIAKVYRDNLMKEYAKLYPNYGFEENAGYGSQQHIQSIKKYGPCKIHRISFLRNII